MNKYFKILIGIFLALLFCLFLFWYEIYIPKNPWSKNTIIYTAQKGLGDDEISVELQKLDIIKSNYFFRFYVIFTGNHAKLQAGKYIVSSNMSMANIAKKFIKGDVIKEKITILEGWDLKDVQNYLVSKKVCKKEEFAQIVSKDFSLEFAFLKEKPVSVTIEGFIFPDTYEISLEDTCEQIIKKTLINFDKKLTQDLREEIVKQKKSIFDIVTMASIIEKEVRKSEDKKIVSGILWNRILVGMPLQVDSTVNYITNKNDPGVLIKDTKIDSPYNTYKYTGLPKGPISNPGLDSIMAAIYPKGNNYLYYLSDKTGKTIFSKTLDQHNIARAKYLGY